MTGTPLSGVVSWTFLLTTCRYYRPHSPWCIETCSELRPGSSSDDWRHLAESMAKSVAESRFGRLVSNLD